MFTIHIISDCIIISVLDTVTSLMAGCVIFAVLGTMAKNSGKNIDDVVTSGTKDRRFLNIFFYMHTKFNFIC